jgi:transcriptional regulator NrdR family protein
VKQPTAPSPDRERRGIECPRCGCRHFRVIYTRAAWGGGLRRRRECRYCGHRITTTERAQ